MREVDFELVRIARTLVVKMLVPSSATGPTCTYIYPPRSKLHRLMVISADFSLCPCAPFMVVTVTCFILRCMRGYIGAQQHHH